ncbi:peptide deformylase [Orenia metallireducens]|uniref:Peptide deformylase n=2 Tax=Orenia metallireducens TaxID=1413210 RepID=A0A1C0A6P2_9FIRM|nr:peptide deformylase [Orenia metallireducens]
MPMQIRRVGDPVLRTEVKEVVEVTDKIRNLLDNMAKKMYQADGVGLAAPQVGISKQLVVIDIGQGLIELINPQIIQKSEKTYIDQEACLSIPNQTGKVERNYKVTVKALNRHGEEIKLEGKGSLARAFQHEIDHLQGILFIDKVI